MTEEHKTYSLKPPANVVVETNTRPYAYEVGLDVTAKGWVQPNIKVRSDMTENLVKTTIILLDKLVKDLRYCGYRVAVDIEEIPKNGKD